MSDFKTILFSAVTNNGMHLKSVMSWNPWKFWGFKQSIKDDNSSLKCLYGVYQEVINTQFKK